MKTSAALSLLALASAASAQDAAGLASLAQALTSLGLTRLVSIASSLNGTTTGQSLLANLTNGEPHLVFAPNNAAWDAAPSNITGNATILADFFAYHIVPGNFSGSATNYPNVTLGETLYNDPATVRLPSGSQVVAWAVRSDNKTHVLNQRNDSTVVNVTTAGNLTIFVVDHILQVPESFEDTIPTNDNSLTGFEEVLRSAQLSYYNASTNATSDVSFFDALNAGYEGFTLFSPNNTAIEAANSSLTSLASNRTALNNVLFNHIINVSTLYSPELTGSTNYTTTSGETLSFSINSTGQYVTSGNITAKIIQPDVLLPNGVVHIIDQVLVNTESNQEAASSALSSAVSEATNTASQTAPGPIGFSQTQSLGGPSGTSSAGSGSGSGGSSGAMSLSAVGKGMMVAAAGVIVGGWMTLL